MSKWTRFMDMHSGGGTKHDAEYIYIEAPEAEARVIFYNLFGTNPDRVSCTCCGNDYSIDESDSLEQATAFERGCAYVYRRPDGSECDSKEAWVMGEGTRKGYTSGYEERQEAKYSPYVTLAKHLKSKGVRVIYEANILPEHRTGSIPEQGYVWHD